MRWTCGLLFAAVIAGVSPASAEALTGDAPYSQRLVDWTEQGREIYNIVKKLPKGTDKEVYGKYSKEIYSMHRKLLYSKKNVEGTDDCRKNLSYLGGWIELFYDFRIGRSKRTMGPSEVKEYQDWTEKGYLKYYQECQRLFKTLNLSPSK